MRKKHNILLVTNDHIDTLNSMANNTITISAIDRSKVKINERLAVDGDLALLAMSIGEKYQYLLIGFKNLHAIEYFLFFCVSKIADHCTNSYAYMHVECTMMLSLI